MRAAWALIAFALLYGCKNPETQDADANTQSDVEYNQQSLAAASPDQAPARPTKDEKASYNEARVTIILLMAQCRVARAQVNSALMQGDPYSIYSVAKSASDACENASYGISQVDFSKVGNAKTASDLKAADEPCSLFAYTLEKAFSVIADAANQGGPLHPADVDEVQTRTADALKYQANCESGLDAVGVRTGLDDIAKRKASKPAERVSSVERKSPEATSPAMQSGPTDNEPVNDDLTHRRARAQGWCDSGSDVATGDIAWKRCGAASPDDRDQDPNPN